MDLAYIHGRHSMETPMGYIFYDHYSFHAYTCIFTCTYNNMSTVCLIVSFILKCLIQYIIGMPEADSMSKVGEGGLSVHDVGSYLHSF